MVFLVAFVVPLPAVDADDVGSPRREKMDRATVDARAANMINMLSLWIFNADQANGKTMLAPEDYIG